VSNYFNRRGAYDEAIAVAQRALALATASGEVVLQALANLYLGRAYKDQGAYYRAIDCFGQAVASFDEARRRELFGQVFLPAVALRAELAECHAELGTFAEGRALGEEGLQIAEVVDHPASLMQASWRIGQLALRQGDLPRALPSLERAVGLCREVDLPAWSPEIAVALGAVYTMGGRITDGVRLLTFWLPQAEAALAEVEGH
jgi:tetratricopeptide (TPR) repeat protein